MGVGCLLLLHTELTSGIPLGPAGPSRRVVEALQRRRGGVDGVAARHDVRVNALVHGGVVVITTTTGIVITGRSRHCSVLPGLRCGLEAWIWLRVSVGVLVC